MSAVRKQVKGNLIETNNQGQVSSQWVLKFVDNSKRNMSSMLILF